MWKLTLGLVYVRLQVCILCRSYGIDLFGQQTIGFKENN